MFVDEKKQGEAYVAAEPWRQVLLDAADYIDKHGWCQHQEESKTGQVCAFMALKIVTDGDIMRRRLPQRRFERFVGLHTTAFNDVFARTAEDVTTAMRDCAAMKG
jgi:hypothetical protein